MKYLKSTNENLVLNVELIVEYKPVLIYEKLLGNTQFLNLTIRGGLPL